MRILAFAVASVALLGATSAAAQEVFNIQASAGSSYFLSDGDGFIEVPLAAGAGRFPPGGVGTGGATYNSFVNVGETAIFFESSNVVSQGQFSSFSSYSELSFSIETDSEFNFHSQITPQGLGFYLADTSGGCLFSYSCAQVPDTLYQFDDLSVTGGGNGFLAGAQFTFEIFDNESSIYSLSGAYFLTDGLGPCDGGFCVIDGLTGGAGEVLNDFAMQTDPLDYTAIAFGWGATDVDLGMGAGFHQITYRTTVSTFTNADCIGPGSTVCLLAYAGFGDPIGRGGGIAEALAPVDFGGFDLGSQEHTLGGLIQGLTFTTQVFNIPTFEDGVLTYATSNGAIPEPGTWALMIFGFGTMGAALRRRRIPAHI